MTLQFLNTLGGRLEPFEPIDAGNVRVYSCGPTVYGPAHVGNFRSFVFADLLRRYLGFRGYPVTWVMNITDVDDRIIRDALSKGVTIDELTSTHIERFRADCRLLRITPPDVMPRATEHIPQMAELIRTLLEKGHAYRTDDGSIFFRISSWGAYGRLARLDPSQQRVGERVEADDYSKDDARDFALWKGPKDGEPSWSTPIGEGRPGWHLECSAMSMEYLGPSFDLHTGGIDLIFPHHEDEIAQSEAATGAPFVRMWLHCAHLRTSGQKMARRSGHTIRPSDLYEQGISPRVLRYALLSVHYRAPLEFTDDSLPAAAGAVERLSAIVGALQAYREDRPSDETIQGALDEAREGFVAALDADLNISQALAAVFDLVKELNRRIDARSLATSDAAAALALLRDVDQVLGILPEVVTEVPADVAELLQARARARDERDWARADELRALLSTRDVIVEDTRDGQRWRHAVEVDGDG